MEVTTVFEPIPVQWEGLTKKDIEGIADAAVNSLMQTGDVLHMAERISAFEAFLKAVKADPRFTGYVRDELAKNGGKITTASGAKIETMEAGTKYHFENCEDPILRDLINKKEQIDEQVKNRYDFLKNVPAEGVPCIDLESGEIVTIYPPYKTSTSTYRVILAK